MKLKLTFLLMTVVCFARPVSAQNYMADFKALVAKDDTAAAFKLLQGWQKTGTNDPDFYIASANYYAKKGLTEVLSLQKDQPAGQSFVLKDSTGKVAGYLGGRPAYNSTYLNKAFDNLDAGITKFPNRLDIRFGKVYLLGKTEDYKAFAEEIIKAVNYGQTISFKWLWSEGKSIENPEDFMLSNIQTYIIQLYNAGDQNMDYIRDVSLAILKYKPDNVVSLSDLSISYLTKKDYTNALEVLLKAEKLAPHDYIVLNNIAYCYELQGNKPNAVKYYQLVKQYGDEEAKVKADKKVAELSKH
ncbi:tetratricopeptide repeat protein [Mucilaginibacter rubeus]|uniref:Tetratricopeptide repeat protein n=1 Tax=Mucilaginibacter rubeus TaxID=2027860 RepID=A0A5C1I4J1_9SPHI|nr:tetratricopeptide repeat protein [Mucilaginibacter rubeus]QEM12776.1 tetratricopeptide repeat protein [Mucilaginibacter rubeus]